MYLKSLTLHGFKSFADKTHFEFHKGVTGIVGPNGCGKSNVVDAIRWVLGETSAKALRGDEMADVIFNGTDKRKPVGLAEVTLTMADCEESLKVDFNEVAITRRVYRDGKSEYRLNNTVCRLKDIHDLIAGTGIGRAAYSIMAQGQIDMLLSSKPEDRRTVFEEAAGITKFKSQKREALRKLEYTEANLLRVADIIAEVKRQMGSLQRQAAKARRYQALLEDTRLLDTHLAHKQYTEFSGEKSESENQVRMLANQLAETQSRLQAAEAEAAQTREAYHAIESQISQARQQAQELRSQMQSAEGRIGFNRERSEDLMARIRQNEEQMANNEELLEQTRSELVNADDQLAQIRENIAQRQQAVNEHGGQHQNLIPERNRLDGERRAIREAIRQFEGQMASSEARAQSLTNQIAADRQRHESLAHDRQGAAQVREASQLEYDELHRQISELEQTRDELDEKAKNCARDIIERRRQRDAMNNELNELQRTLTQRRSRLEIIEQLLQKGEGLSAGTQKVLAGLDNPEVYSTGVRGLLASSIEVADPAFIPAIEAALKDHLQAVLLTESELAAQIVQRLADQQMGRAALFPQDFINLRSQADRELLPGGAIAWATDKVRVKNGVQSLIDHLLHNVVITDHLHTALQLKRQLPHLAIATMRGEFISADGIIYGGASKDEENSTLRREAEVKHLRTEVETLELQFMEKEDVLKDLTAQLEDMQREEVALREQSQKAREGFSALQGKMSVVQRALQQASAKLESIEWDQNQISERIGGSESIINQMREAAAMALEQLEGSRVRENELELEMEAFLRRELESSERLNELRTALALEQSALGSIERQKTPLGARMQELAAAIRRFDEEIATWRVRIEQSEAENARYAEQIESQKGAIAAIEDHLNSKTDERAGLFEQVSRLESQLTQLRQSYNGLNESRSRAEVALTRVDLRLENLINQVQERYSFHISAFEPDYHVLMMTIEEQKKNRSRGKKAASSAEQSDSSDMSDPSDAAEDTAEVEEPAEIPAISNRDDDEISIDEVVIPDEQAEPDWAFVMEVVYELRQKLEGIGAVNLDAIQEFEELEERHRFLETQHGDLVKGKEELLNVIAKINETTKLMFSETFTAVRNYFQNNFKELFGPQAKADLMLVDEADPLESGIEIIAKPPGKKLQTISLLSGGERSMTAVALLFSIYQVKPSPFCVLDELDAPLDETNIGRFLKMLDNFIDNSQFIIVTHNKRTMSRADVIYGVTMQEFGVSKPVGVRMTTEDTRTLKKSDQELALEAPAAPKRRKKGEEAEEDAQAEEAPLNDLDAEQQRLTEIEEREEESPAVLV